MMKNIQHGIHNSTRAADSLERVIINSTTLLNPNVLISAALSTLTIIKCLNDYKL